MTEVLQHVSVVALVVFCRIGACFMLVPGFSTVRIPTRIRVLAAFAISAALTPLVYDKIAGGINLARPEQLLPTVAGEIAIGGFIGLLARLELLALHFATLFAGAAIGLQGMPGQPMEDSEASPALVTLISMAATLILLASGLYVEILHAVVGSYGRLPAGNAVDSMRSLRELAKVLGDSSLMAMRIAGPIAVYSIVVNFAIGLAGKFAPQISLYFASLGVVTIGGMLLLYLVAPAWLNLYTDSFSGFLMELGGG